MITSYRKPVKRRSGHDMIDSGLIFYDYAGCTWHASSLPVSIHDFYILYLEGVTIVMHKGPVPIPFSFPPIGMVKCRVDSGDLTYLSPLGLAF